MTKLKIKEGQIVAIMTAIVTARGLVLLIIGVKGKQGSLNLSLNQNLSQ
jgi:hypothetical protein